jgi:hypothetical protein
MDPSPIATAYEGREQVTLRGLAIGVVALLHGFGFQDTAPPAVFGTPN